MSHARTTIYRPPSFAHRDDAHQIKTMTHDFPYRWHNGQRDSIESLCVVLTYARDMELYRKCGCDTWQEYCRRFYGAPADAFDALIEAGRLLNGRRVPHGEDVT